MPVVAQVRNVFGVGRRTELEECLEWLDEQNADWDIYYPDEFVSALHDGLAGNEYLGPWMIFITEDTVAVAFKLRFC